MLPRDLIEERSRIPEDSERADLVRAGLAVLLLFSVTLAVCGVERRLARELAGYAEYAARVRFRILPRVW